MKMLDLSKFEKVKEDKHTATMRHKDGHEMTILIAKLPKIHREQLKRLKMADGGMAHYDKGATPISQTDAPALNPSIQDLQQAQGSAQNIAKEPVPVDGSEPAYQQAPVQTPQYQGNLLQQQGQGVLGGQEQYALGAKQRAQAEANLAQGSEKYNQEVAAAEEQRKVQVAQATAVADTAAKNLKAYMETNDGKVDAQHFQRNMTDQRKVSTALGLILGGISGGINGTGVNPVLNYLMDQQNKDIEAQKASYQQGLTGQKTVFDGYMQQFHNVGAATALTRIADNNKNLFDLKKLANQQGTLDAAGRYNQAAGVFNLQNAAETRKAAGYLTLDPLNSAQPNQPSQNINPSSPQQGTQNPNQNESVNSSEHLLRDDAEKKYKLQFANDAIDPDQKAALKRNFEHAKAVDIASDILDNRWEDLVNSTTFGGWASKKIDPVAMAKVGAGAGALAGGTLAGLGALGTGPGAGATLPIIGTGASVGAGIGGGAGEIGGLALKGGLRALGGQGETQFQAKSKMVKSLISSALKGGGMTPTAVGEIADSITPDWIDSFSKQTTDTQKQMIKDKMRNSVDRGALETYGWANKLR